MSALKLEEYRKDVHSWAERELDIRDTNISEIPIDVYYKNILTTNENLRILRELEILDTTFAPRE